MKLSGVITRYVNGACCVNISHKTRIIMVTMLSVLSFVSIAMASRFSKHIIFFYIALFASVLMGVASSLGEACVLGFLKAFPLNMISDFGSGTGFAGPFATLSLLTMRANGIADSKIFCIQMTFMFVFYFCF